MPPAHNDTPGSRHGEDDPEAYLGTATTVRWDQSPFAKDGGDSASWLRRSPTMPPLVEPEAIAAVLEPVTADVVASTRTPRAPEAPAPAPARGLARLVPPALMVVLAGVVMHYAVTGGLLQ